MSARLEGLAALTEAALNAKRAELAAQMARVAALKAEIAQIDATRRESLNACAPESPAGRANAALAWLRWVDGRQRQLGHQLARDMAVAERLRAELAKRFGRNSAVEGLRSRLAQEARVQAQRRADRLG